LDTVKLENGETTLIKKFALADKEKLFQTYESLSDETMRWGIPPYARERIEKGWLSNLQNLISIVALFQNRIVGHSQIFRFPHSRRKGTGDLIIYVHQDFQDVGLGTVMLIKLLQLAKKDGMHRIALHVVADNKRAVHLYEKLGFKIEGFLRDSYFGEDKQDHQELAMGLMLDN
jgi:RimJ/RimL family protein N-acetyltransferase